MRPLVRWTVGIVSSCGMEVLKHSVVSFKKVYPEFDHAICYNNIPYPQELEPLGVPLYEQSNDEIDYPLSSPDKEPIGFGMVGSGWKLTPPRLRMSSLELWLDNDVVIRDRVPEIDEWLEKRDYAVISEGLHGNYGIYKQFVPPFVKVCAGVFGLPADFNFHSAILGYCEYLGGEPLGHYNEQGLVSAIVTNSESYVVISMSNLMICEDSVPVPKPPAIHFVGVNRNEDHGAWHQYKNKLFI